MGKKLNRLLIISTTLLSMGCTIDYNEDLESTIKSESIPDSIMRNFKLVKIKNNSPYTEVESSLTEIYNNQNKTVLHNVIFTEYDTNSKSITTTGKADNIEYYHDTEDAKLKGNLKFVSKKEEVEMTGEDLYWNKNDKKISSSTETSIEVIKEDGSRMKGYGFSANLERSTFSFEKGITGRTE